MILNMEKFIKIFVFVFAATLLVAIIYIKSLPQNRTTIDETFQINSWVNDLNNDLPRNIGSIGTLDRITFEDNRIHYHMSVHGDVDIMDFYKHNYMEYKELLMYSLILLNGQNNNADKFAKYLSYKEWGLKLTIKVIDGRSVSWEFAGQEMEDFIMNCKLNPTSALCKTIDMQIEMAKLSIPINNDDYTQIQSVTANTLLATIEEGFELIDIKHIDNDIVFEFRVDESKANFNLADLKIASQLLEFKKEFANTLAEDVDIREFFNLVVISHSNFVMRYYGNISEEVVDVYLPYFILKNYCNVPGNILND